MFLLLNHIDTVVSIQKYAVTELVEPNIACWCVRIVLSLTDSA